MEQCMTTCGEAAGFEAKKRSRARKEAAAKEVRGYYNQFAEAKPWNVNPWLKMKFSILLIWRRSHREIKYVCLPSRRTNRVTSSRQRQDGCWEISKTNRININRMIVLLQQDLDFGWVATWQPARVGTLFTLILRQLSFNESESVNRDVVCHLLPQAGHPPSLDQALCSYGMIPMRADRCCYVLYSTPTCKPNWNQRCSTQVNSTIDISLK